MFPRLRRQINWTFGLIAIGFIIGFIVMAIWR